MDALSALMNLPSGNSSVDVPRRHSSPPFGVAVQTKPFSTLTDLSPTATPLPSSTSSSEHATESGTERSPRASASRAVRFVAAGALDFAPVPADEQWQRSIPPLRLQIAADEDEDAAGSFAWSGPYSEVEEASGWMADEEDGPLDSALAEEAESETRLNFASLDWGNAELEALVNVLRRTSYPSEPRPYHAPESICVALGAAARACVCSPRRSLPPPSSFRSRVYTCARDARATTV